MNMMKRTPSVPLALAVVLGIGLSVFGTPTWGQSPSEWAETAAVTAKNQNADGGFGPAPGQPSSLGATSSALRILKYTGGAIPDALKAIEYVKSCWDPASGGFGPAPGKPAESVPGTATGLMAAAELKILTPEMVQGAIGFFSQRAKAFEDVRMAIAGMEAVGKPSPDFPRWKEQILKDRGPDGGFGSGDGRAFATGGIVAALLRMGENAENHQRANVVDIIKKGQRPDGGWSEGAGPSNLSATYRVMRALFMLKESPDLDRLQGFIAKCRNADGTYRTAPDATGSGGTYFAAIVTYWSRQLAGQPVVTETAGFLPLFNGKDLTGWEGDTSLWSVKDGRLVGTSPGIKRNEFLATEANYDHFLLKLRFRLRGADKSNSGVQFRSVRVKGSEMSGYQADIGDGWWGSLYDESRRNRILVKASPAAEKSVKRDGWNGYEIRALGNDIRLSLNGQNSVAYHEEDSSIPQTGKIATQIHAGGPMTVEFEDIYLQRIPNPTPDADNAVNATPGFHLRTHGKGADARKYTLYLPPGYDGTQTFPVVMFLHGSGERGVDGVTSAQVGLGPAILRDPKSYPVIAIFPQARQTWSADSPDGKAALAILDEVLSTYKADRSRVILTGLSMGGAGTWGLAAKAPERFLAIAPICGRGQVGNVEKFKDLPTWCLVGDNDRFDTVKNSRDMVGALRSLGNAARYTEYRNVGHNSWDRAYNDPELIAWLLAQKPRGQ